MGRDHGKEVEVIEGLNEKERVVSNPSDTLEDGLKVKAVLMEKPVEKKEEKKNDKGKEKKIEPSAAPGAKGKA